MEKLIEIFTRFADFLIYGVLELNHTNTFANALNYFITAFTTVSLLVLLVTYLMGTITSYLQMEIREYLKKNKRSGFGNVTASIFGAVTPFCSCSSIPLFIGMIQSKIPLGICLSFLITSPLVNEIAIAIFWVIFGWKVTLTYIISGIILGVLGGIMLEKMRMSDYLADWLKNLTGLHPEVGNDKRSFMERLPLIHYEAIQTLKRLIPYIFIGIAIGSFIHGYVPETFFVNYLSRSNPFAVPIAVVASIPLYIDAVGILPIMDSLVEKGVPLGTAIAFMMGSIGLSVPEALLLKKVMKKKLILAFFSTMAVGMVLSGYLFNLLFYI